MLIFVVTEWCQRHFFEFFTTGNQLPVRDLLSKWNADMGTGLIEADDDYRRPERRGFCQSAIRTANELWKTLNTLEWD
jgi:hypothetical protein